MTRCLQVNGLVDHCLNFGLRTQNIWQTKVWRFQVKTFQSCPVSDGSFTRFEDRKNASAVEKTRLLNIWLLDMLKTWAGWWTATILNASKWSLTVNVSKIHTASKNIGPSGCCRRTANFVIQLSTLVCIGRPSLSKALVVHGCWVRSFVKIGSYDCLVRRPPKRWSELVWIGKQILSPAAPQPSNCKRSSVT